MKKRPASKFDFGVDFQEHILQYIASDSKGYTLLDLISDEYFGLLTHQFVAFAIKKYYRKKKRVPGYVALGEYIRQLYTHRDYKQYSTLEFQEDIAILLKKLYSGVPRDSDDIVEEVVKFAQYTELKNELDNVDLNDFHQYGDLQKRIQKAITIGSQLKGEESLFFIRDAPARAASRALEEEVFYSPYWQLNRSQDSGGLKKNCLIMFMSQPKRFKTGCLLNLSKACLARKKKGLYIDLENGQNQLGTRLDQGVIGKSKKELLRGEFDKQLLKQLRKYKRFGSELVIRRLPAGSTTLDFQKLVDKLKLENGITIDFCIVDYGDLMGALSGKVDDTERISDAYLDLKNFGEHNNLDFIATASHVKREAAKRRTTKYVAEDVAKCIDKIRHVDICIGLQEDEAEKEQGVLRWEIIEQRDGPPEYTMYFWVDIPTQRLTEFTREQVAKLKTEIEDIEKRRNSSKDV